MPLLGAGTSVTGLPVIPVEVRAKGSDTLLRTYTFLDGGSKTTLCSDQLMKELGVRGIDTTLSLTTMERENSTKAISLIQLEGFDLDENIFIELPLVLCTPALPISSESVPHQAGVDRWPHLKGIRVAEIDAHVGLLIDHDVPKALKLKEVKESQDGGQYATRTLLAWAINGPLGGNGNATCTTNFIRRSITCSRGFATWNLMIPCLTMSLDNIKALEIMEFTALPWRYLPSCLLNNRALNID